MKNKVFLHIVIMLTIYIGLRFFGGDIGRRILYPIQLLVTFLHEFGHAIGALITGGSVEKIQINQDGSGFTATVGGSRSIILMGGYIGSALFGNLLFFIGARAKPIVKPMLLILALSMISSGIFWYNSLFTTAFLLGFAAILIFLVFKTNFGREVLMFLGLSTILYIIQDFNVGPSSDLQKYAEIMKVLPPNVWMYIWLSIALLLFAFNLRILYKSLDQHEDNFTNDEDFLTIE